MKTASLLVAVVALSLLPSRSAAQVLWMGSGPVAVGGYHSPYAYAPYSPYAYGASYYPAGYGVRSAAPLGYGAVYSPWRSARAFRAESAPLTYRMPLSTPVQYVYRDGAGGGSANAARASEALAKTSPASILVADFGTGARDKDIQQALDEARKWKSDPTIIRVGQDKLLVDIAAAQLEEAATPALKKAKTELHTKISALAQNLRKNNDYKVFNRVYDDWNSLDKFAEANGIKKTMKLIRAYMAQNQLLNPTVEELNEQQRNTLADAFDKIVQALRKEN